MQTVKISVICCLSALLLGLAVPALAIPTDYTKDSFEDPNTFKFNKNKFVFRAAIDPTSSHLTGTWDISVDLNALKKGDLTTSNVTGYYLETNIETGGSEVVAFSESFSRFTLGENPEESKGHYLFDGAFTLNHVSEIAPDDADLWYIHGNFISYSNNKYDVFNGWVSYKAPDVTPGPGDPVPEPATMMLVGTGVICLAAVRNRRKE